MAELTIRLRRNPETGKRDIVISLSEDPDALPHEHEQMHRRIVDRLIEGGLLSAAEAGAVIIEREEGHDLAAPASDSLPLEERQGESLGQ